MNDESNLTPSDHETIAKLIENGANAVAGEKSALDPAKRVTCSYCGHEWEYTGAGKWPTCGVCGRASTADPTRPDGRGITQAMCNAIRAAAHDGKPYTEIAAIFTFVNVKGAVSAHARGECSHADELDPIRPRQLRTEPVDAEECRRIRQLAVDYTQTELAEQFDRDRKTIRNHIFGDCSH